MTLFQIECFVILADSLNFTQAAQSLFITQPALSRHISALENEIDVQLFERNTRKVRLTHAGLYFLEEARGILSSSIRGVQRAQQAKKGTIGMISIGFLRDNIHGFLMELANTFSIRNPDIILNLRAYSYSHMTRLFETGLIDFAFINSEGLRTITNYDYILIRSAPMCVVLHESHPLANHNNISIAELKEESFISIDKKSSIPAYQTLINYCMTNKFFPKIQFEEELVTSLLTMVGCKQGIAILPEFLSDIAPSCLRFIPVKRSQAVKQIMVWKENNPNVCKDLFIKTVEDLIKSKQ